MRNLNDLNDYRLRAAEVDWAGGTGDNQNGVFAVPYPRTGVSLNCIASVGDGWEHVSVSLKHRVPNWYEMDFVKRTFFRPDETVMQLHVPEADHVNLHPNCLHLWKPIGQTIPRPPSEMVA